MADLTETNGKKKLIIEEGDEEIIIKNKNKGTGAGGANTNKNGLSYEEITDLNELYSMSLECDLNKKDKYKKIKFIGYDNIEFINANKSMLHKYMKNNNQKEDLDSAAGCKSPDEAYINENTKTLFIIEKKFQQTPGSCDEKIQTGPFKKKYYEDLFPKYTIHYIYCLSDWFNQDDYKSVIKILKETFNIPVFWGNDKEYKNNIIKFMCS